jgi:hypothetical protein
MLIPPPPRPPRPPKSPRPPLPRLPPLPVHTYYGKTIITFSHSWLPFPYTPQTDNPEPPPIPVTSKITKLFQEVEQLPGLKTISDA